MNAAPSWRTPAVYVFTTVLLGASVAVTPPSVGLSVMGALFGVVLGIALWSVAGVPPALVVLTATVLGYSATGQAFNTLGARPFTIPELLAGLLAGLGVLQLLNATPARRDRSVRRLMVPVAVLGVAAVASTITGVFADAHEPLRGLLLPLYLLAGYGAYVTASNRPRASLRILNLVGPVAMCGMAVTLALGERFSSPAFSIYISLAICLAAGRYLRRGRRSDFLALLIVLGSLILLLSMGKRSALIAPIAAGAALALVFTVRKRASELRRLKSIGAAVLVITPIVLGVSFIVGGVDEETAVVRLVEGFTEVDSNAALNFGLRLAMWEHAVEGGLAQPLTGAGWGAPMDVVYRGMPYNNPTTGAHNSFLGFLYYGGAPLLLALLWSLVTLTSIVRKLVREVPAEVASGLVGLVVATVAISFVNVGLETPAIGGFAFVTAGTLLGVSSTSLDPRHITSTRSAAQGRDPVGAPPAAMPHG